MEFGLYCSLTFRSSRVWAYPNPETVNAAPQNNALSFIVKKFNFLINRYDHDTVRSFDRHLLVFVSERFAGRIFDVEYNTITGLGTAAPGTEVGAAVGGRHSVLGRRAATQDHFHVLDVIARILRHY